ncbi:unnamed protein product [Heligmosomoides polygyrus]|uniref:Reverse transcriptase domain-containing protein n=1 Tax=Heligmosomoides polygyrus TaxID=6339 RepID=A0A183GDA7_HELPZ|nr:unnamed protein product [Heligmosomoides polygyrus]
MKPSKATGPDDVAADVWKSKFWHPAEWLAKFFNQVVAEKKVPCWRQFRFGRRRAVRGRELFVTSSNFPAIKAASWLAVARLYHTRLVIDKHREKQKPVHIAFLDLEKAYRVPREVIWYALRHHGVPEEPIEWVRILYSCPKFDFKLQLEPRWRSPSL